MPPRIRDLSRSLTRQSILVAGCCLVADTSSFRLTGLDVYPTVTFWCLMVALVLADAALASPASLSGVVALGQAALAVTGALTLQGDGPLPDLNDTGMLIAAYRAGAWLHGRPAWAALACLLAGSAATQVIHLGGVGDWRLLLLHLVQQCPIAWLVGRYTAARGARIAELEQRTEREREKAQQALDDAIASERSAIARDLHDVIAHHVSAIGVHAGAARLGLKSTETTPMSTALAAVETSSRTALLDLRRLLDFLHDRPPEGARQPGLDNLNELTEAVTAAGLTARVTVEGTPVELADAMDIAAYRVVQEMLTNALRHGDGRVGITLAYTPSSLTVTSVNRTGGGAPFAADTPHRGLEGISSRAGMFDGFATYGPVDGGARWKTTVTFPLDAS